MNILARRTLSPAPAGLVCVNVCMADAASERLPGRIGDELAFGAAGPKEGSIALPGLGIGAELRVNQGKPCEHGNGAVCLGKAVLPGPICLPGILRCRHVGQDVRTAVENVA